MSETDIGPEEASRLLKKYAQAQVTDLQVLGHGFTGFRSQILGVTRHGFWMA